VNDDTCCDGRCNDHQGRGACPRYRRTDASPKGIDVSGIAPPMRPARWALGFVVLVLTAITVARLVAIDSDRAEAFRRECREKHNGSAYFDQSTQRLACRVTNQ
jgi:hypothetical protein